MRKTPAILAAVALAATGTSAAAMTSPALIDPSSLAGTWALSSGGKTCHLALSVSRAADGRNHELDLGDCVEAGFPRLRGWSSEPDGIGFALDGGQVLFLSKEDAGRFSGKGRDGRAYVLTRNG
jgi:hypothetical protein